MLKPDKSYFQNGITLNEFFITNHSNNCAALSKNNMNPSNITIYSFPDVPIKSYISLAEFYSRQVYYNNFKGLIPHYLIDSIAIWQLLPENIESTFPNSKNKIIIVICGDNQKAKIRTVDLACKILKTYNLGLNNINLVNNSNPMFFDLLEEKINKLGLPAFVTAEEPAEIIDKAAHCDFQVYFNSKWQAPIRGCAIQAIRIKVTEGELYYRTHLINGGWLPWVSNGEMSGHTASYIDGFQIKYISKQNKILYKFSIINSKPISWRTTNILVPTKQFLDDFEFKIEPI